MPLITIRVYRTTVVDGVATISEPYELTVNDVNGDNTITRDEWIATTGDVAGHIGGTVGGAPALWDGTTGGTNLTANGFLYTAEPISTTAPSNLIDTQAILAAVTHAPKYEISIADLTICFVAGTLIETADGPRPVEALQPGDLVLTRDHGLQPLGLGGPVADRCGAAGQLPQPAPDCHRTGRPGPRPAAAPVDRVAVAPDSGD